MIKYWWNIVQRTPGLAWHSTHRFEAIVGVALFVVPAVLAVLNAKNPDVLSQWVQNHPALIWIPLALWFLHAVMKAIYETYRNVEIERDILTTETIRLRDEVETLSKKVAESQGNPVVQAAFNRDEVEYYDEGSRCSQVAIQIFKLADSVPTPKTTRGVMTELHEIVGSHSAILYGTPARDWKVETKAALSAMVQSEIIDRYETCLQSENPEIGAKSFLRSLASSLKPSDLR